MIELKKKGYTYGTSYEGYVFWRLDSTGKGIFIGKAGKLGLKYNCPNNTFRESTAKKITKQEFEKAFTMYIVEKLPQSLKQLLKTKTDGRRSKV